MKFLENINYYILEDSTCFLFWQQNKLSLFNCFVLFCFSWLFWNKLVLVIFLQGVVNRETKTTDAWNRKKNVLANEQRGPTNYLGA